MFYASACGVIMVFAASALITVFRPALLGLYAKETAVIQSATYPLMIMIWSYPLYAVAESAIGCLRGMWQSTGPTLLNAFCITAPRILWVLVIFPLKPTFLFLYICYPISWAICAIVQVWYYLRCRRQIREIEGASATN